MSKHSGRRVARGPERPTARSSSAVSPAPSSPGRGLFLLAGGITVTLIAWGVLVFIAIEFGRQARTGSSTAWGLLGLATVGAAACLYLTLLLAMKTVEVMQRKPAARPAAAPAAVPSQRVVTGVGPAVPPPSSPKSSLSPSSSVSSPSSPSRSAPHRARHSVQHPRRPARTPGKRVKR